MGVTVIVLHGPISGSRLFDTDGIPDFLGKKTILKKFEPFRELYFFLDVLVCLW